MPSTITLTISDKKNVSGRIQVTDENVIKQIFPDYKNKTVTMTQFEQLQKIARNGGNKDVLETCDFTSSINRLKAEIVKGNASLSGGIINVIIGGTYKGDIYLLVPEGTTMGEVKEMYNLPDGSLSNYCRHAGCPGGNKDLFKSTGQVWFSAEVFAKSNNMTLEEVKVLFKE